MKKIKTNIQKSTKLIAINSLDVWYCDNMNEVKDISGVKFIRVSRQPSGETYLMRKDAFKKA